MVDEKEIQISLLIDKYGFYQNIKINDSLFQPIYLAKKQFSIKDISDNNKEKEVYRGYLFDIKQISETDFNGRYIDHYQLTYGKGIPDAETTDGAIIISLDDLENIEFELHYFKKILT